MKKNKALSILTTAVVSLVVSVLFLNWILDSDPGKKFWRDSKHENLIKQVSFAKLSDTTYSLQIELTHAVSCANLISGLEFTPITTEERVYVPTCEMVSGNNYRIIYEPSTQ